MNLSSVASNPLFGLVLRALLGAYVIYMARKFYADPTGYFRRSMRALPDLAWLAPEVRSLAVFCLWGGCFIVATAIAVQVLPIRGDVLALMLVAVAAIATWFLLPRGAGVDVGSSSGRHNSRGVQ
jgi:uncharacterized membrane-anchored protein